MHHSLLLQFHLIHNFLYLNLLLNIGFNKEVAEDAAVYWTKAKGNLAALIDKADKVSPEKRAEYGKKAKQRIKDSYSWKYICNKYEDIFTKAVTL